MSQATRARFPGLPVQLAAGLLALGLLPPSAAALEYRAPGSRWSMRVPNGWRQLSDVEFSELVASLPGGNTSWRVRHVVAFRPIESEAYPTLIVSELAIERASLEKLAKSLEKLRGSAEFRDALEAADARQVEIGRPAVDSRRKLVITESIALPDAPDEGEVVTLSALFPGRHYVVQLLAYCGEDLPRTRVTFDALLDSFRFDAGHEYAPPMDRDALLVFAMLCVIGGAIYRKYFKDDDRGWRSRRAGRDQRPTEQGPDPTGYVGP